MEFHFSARRVRAGTRGGALGVSGYITGRASIDGVRINNPHTPDEIAFTGLALPADARIESTVELWRTADLAERKRDGEYRRNGGHTPILANHGDLALPWGATDDEAQRVIDRVCEYLVNTHHVAVEYAVHRRNGKIDHAHFLWTSRTVGPEGIGKKARGLNAIAQRQNKQGSESALEEIRKIASKAIRDICNVDWDHRSFKRRGIDKFPEPKLDQRLLREQRRRIEKLGIDATTKIERDLNLFRVNRKIGIGTSLIGKQKTMSSVSRGISDNPKIGEEFTIETGSADLLRKTLLEQIQKKEKEEEEDEWIAKLIRINRKHKIQEYKIKGNNIWQWIAEVDEPDFNPKDIYPINVKFHKVEELEIAETALYAEDRKDYDLRNKAVLALAVSRKKTFAHILWVLQCYFMHLVNERELDKFLPPHTLYDREIFDFITSKDHARCIIENTNTKVRGTASGRSVNRGRGGIGD